MKRWVAAAAVFLLVVAAVVAAVPSFRLSLVGARLAHHLQKGSSEDLAVVSILSSGNEVRPLSEGAGALLPGQATPETYDLRMTLEETVDAEDVLRYRVREVRSEQLGTSGGQDLIGGVVLLHLEPGGLVRQVVRQKGEPSGVMDDRLLAETLASAWPGLPSGLARPGTVWSARYEAPLDLNYLAPAKVVLQHRLQYLLEGYHEEAGLRVARLQVRGEVVPRAEGEVPEGTQVDGTGKVEGTVVVDLATGRAVIGDDRTASSVRVRFQDKDLEVVTFTDRRTRFWRPRWIPNGMEGFSAELPVPEETAAPASPAPGPG